MCFCFTSLACFLCPLQSCENGITRPRVISCCNPRKHVGNIGDSNLRFYRKKTGAHCPTRRRSISFDPRKQQENVRSKEKIEKKVPKRLEAPREQVQPRRTIRSMRTIPLHENDSRNKAMITQCMCRSLCQSHPHPH